MDVPPSTTVTTLPASAVPLMAGVVSFVVPPDAGLLIVGALGAVVSTITVTGVDVGLVLPAMSLCVAVSMWLPSVNGALGVQLQLPLTSAVVEQIGVPPSSTFTIAPGSAPIPLIDGVGLFVLLSETGVVIVGAVVGAVVSTVTLTGVDAGLVPPGLVAVAVIE